MNVGSSPIRRPDPSRGVYSFGAFEVDVRAGEICKNGYKVKLQDQPFRVLEVLLRQPGEVVTREELQRQIWPADTFVDFDRGLNNAVKRLREALGDSAENPRFVETLARRGYRFIGSLNGGGSNIDAEISPSIVPRMVHRANRTPLWTGVAALIVLLIAIGALRFREPKLGQTAAPELRLRRIVASAADDPVNYASLSPDGKDVAYVDGTGIHVKVIETEEVRTIEPPLDSASDQVLNESTVRRFPIAWYPDGTKLLATTSPGPTIWAISLVTGTSQYLYRGGWASSVSPDGSRIAIVKNDSEIWLMGPHGEDPHQFAVAEAGTEIGRVVWSPDGRRIGNFRVIQEPETLVCSIETRSLANPQPVILMTDARLCYEPTQSFWWLPDGRIIFAQSEPDVDVHDFNLWEVGIDANTGKKVGEPSRLTNWGGSFLEGITGSDNGKRLAFLRVLFQTTTTVAELDPSHPGRLKSPRPIAKDQNGEWPTSWTDDGRAVVFYTSKSGDNDIFVQPLDRESPEPLVTGPGEQLAAVLSPDGRSFIYMDVPRFKGLAGESAVPVRLMKIPTSGGPSEPILTAHGYDGHVCLRRPSTLCAVGERSPDGRHFVISSFDPSGNESPRGKGSALFTFDTDPGRNYEWSISPDGSLLSFSKVDNHEIRIRFVSLQGGQSFELNVKGWARLVSMNWAADGRSLFISSRSPGGCSLLEVDLRGHVHVVLQQKGGFQTWGIASPDGRHLAVFAASTISEVWTAENY